MKPINYPDNGRGLFVQYHVMREGPNYFLVNYKNSSVLRQDPKDAWRVLGPAKFTPGAQDLKEWCLEMFDKYNDDKKEGRKDTSFSTLDTAEADPSSNTKMIT